MNRHDYRPLFLQRDAVAPTLATCKACGKVEYSFRTQQDATECTAHKPLERGKHVNGLPPLAKSDFGGRFKW